MQLLPDITLAAVDGRWSTHRGSHPLLPSFGCRLRWCVGDRTRGDLPAPDGDNNSDDGDDGDDGDDEEANDWVISRVKSACIDRDDGDASPAPHDPGSKRRGLVIALVEEATVMPLIPPLLSHDDDGGPGDVVARPVRLSLALRLFAG